MKRRHFLAALTATPFACRLGLLPAALAEESPLEPGGPWRTFEITTHVTLPASAGEGRVWLPLAQSAGDYQTALALQWQGNGTVERVSDAHYGAPILRSTWHGGEGAPQELSVIQTVAVRGERHPAPLLPLTEAERRFWTAPTASASVDGLVLATAARLTAGRDQPRDRLRALYDWVIDHTYRDPDVPGCGTGDLRAILEQGRWGGKCADINSLLVGLARAAGFPAREVYGLRVAPSADHPSLGRTGDVSKAQHCRAEVFLEDEGWFPVDPADVRKVVLEEKVVLESPGGRTLRDRMFGRWEMNWVSYNSATDLRLPGGNDDQQPEFCFLMYPCGFTGTGRLPCLDPARFRYEIRAREVAA